ncbi:tRNA-dihydrouridine synthase family protein [Candidatus Woesearchaeota archaeon]|nr:tRNA-dihydrouridine synthase family protein [Candidatus Woesearchaeota archaeon]
MDIKNALWLSPMEGVSDLGFRSLCVKRGADLTFTEMIRADALVRNNKATIELIDTYLKEVPTGLQLLASKPATLEKVLKMISKKREEGDPLYLNISCIDLNFGCPSKDVITKGAGPALLKRDQRMRDLLTTLKKESPVPCGIKMRLGLGVGDKRNKVYLRVIELANELELDWVTVHSKTADQKSFDPIDLDPLREILAISKVPIIGNGFVTDGKSAKHFFDMGCAGVMIARGAIINPWVFEEIKEYLKTGKVSRRDKDYAAALAEYEYIAIQYNAKDKFLTYHRKTFLDHIKGNFGYHAPTKNKEWV